MGFWLPISVNYKICSYLFIMPLCYATKCRKLVKYKAICNLKLPANGLIIKQNMSNYLFFRVKPSVKPNVKPLKHPIVQLVEMCFAPIGYKGYKRLISLYFPSGNKTNLAMFFSSKYRLASIWVRATVNCFTFCGSSKIFNGSAFLKNCCSKR